MVEIVGTEEQGLGLVAGELALGGVGVKTDGIVNGQQGIVGAGNGRVVQGPDTGRAFRSGNLEQGQVIHPGLVTGITATLVDVVGTQVGEQEDVIVVVVRIRVHQQRLVSSRQIRLDSALGSSSTGFTLVGGVSGKELLTAAGKNQTGGCNDCKNLIEFHIRLHLKD